jgi:superfamily II DNA or RNA helicase/diadenosine tetraphosphate (Ap4A) HIT family hydrolase/HKD family nuclease
VTVEGCPFCAVSRDRVFHESELVVALWDAYPVSPGHALLVPRRHVPDWFAATPQEQASLVAAINVARERILELYHPDGFNIGVNIGEAAGQTVFHLHVHVIPRYSGDVPDPRGGVRHVIPARANYLLTPLPAEGNTLVRGAEDPLLPHLLHSLTGARKADVAVAFVLESGVRRIEHYLRDVLRRGGAIRLLTGDYLDITEPNALVRLLDLTEESPGRVELRVFETKGTSFHPKAYVFHDSQGQGVAYVGSSNLSETALERGIEWNYRIVRSTDGKGFAEILDAFERLFRHPATRPVDAPWIEAYRDRRKTQPKLDVDVLVEPLLPPPEPHVVQREALAALEQTRRERSRAGLVVLATGLGKTWLAAFDSARPEFRRILFVAHRDEILEQAWQTFRRIRPDARLGRYTGQEKAPAADVLFASIQTLSRARHLRQFGPEQFDYIVVDEFHHAAAATYRRLIDYFEPKFLLGLTATPERTDGGDLLALCQENLVYRCDLAEGIRRGLLSPFHYLGVPDEVDYRNIPWRSSRFDEQALTQALATQARAENALEQWQRHAGSRTLAFCCSRQHADFMAHFFREARVEAAAVHSGETSAPRAESLERLARGELKVLFAVDLFNEGVDVPEIDTVLMLRPTESRILWLQQVGRGLRKAVGKATLTVIDYIGNHRSFLTKVVSLFALRQDDREIAAALQRLQEGEAGLPPGCEVTYDLEAMDILNSLLRLPRRQEEALRVYYVDFRQRNGVRPRAVEAYHDRYNPRSARKKYGSWVGLVRAMEDLGPIAGTLSGPAAEFLDSLEAIPHQAWLRAGAPAGDAGCRCLAGWDLKHGLVGWRGSDCPA